MNRRAAEAVVIALLHAVPGEPAGPFVAVDLLVDGALGLEAFVKRRGLHRSACQPVEMGKGDFVAQAVVLFRLHHLPLLRGVAAEAARVIVAHRDVGGPMHHPAREFAGQPRAPANADLGAAAAPVVPHPRCGADQRVAVGRMADGAMHFALDAKLREYGHAVQAFLQPGHDPVVIGVKQPVLVVPRAFVDPDRVGVGLFVDADEAALLFHPDVARDLLVVPDDGEFLVQSLEFRHRLGHEIVVGHGGHGQLQARPFAHLAGIGAARVDHMFAGDDALVGLDHPFAGWGLGDVGRAGVAEDAHALGPRASRHRHRDVGGVDMAVIGGVQRADHPVEVVERVQLGDAVGAHKLDIEAKRAANRQRVAQPVHLVARVGQPEGPAAVPGDGLAGLALQPAGVEPDVVIHAFAKRERAGRMGDLPRRMPGAARGEFGLLQQDRVRAPAFMPEVIGQPDPHHAAADDDHAGVGGKLFLGHRGESCRLDHFSMDRLIAHLYHRQS